MIQIYLVAVLHTYYLIVMFTVKRERELKTREKEKVTWGIDKTVLDAFRKTCKARKQQYGEVVSYLLREYLKHTWEESLKEIQFRKYILRLIKEKEGEKK